MPNNVLVPPQTVTAFLLVLSRVGSAMLFVPIPGIRSGPSASRLLFAASFALALLPMWPAEVYRPADIVHFLGAVLSEVLLGMAIGLLVACFSETLILGAQIISVQSGYSYASTIDPATEAEAGYLLVVAQMLGGLLFFGLHLDHDILRAFARSLQILPPGSFELSLPAIERIGASCSMIFATGLRIVLPVSALLVMTDIALAVMGRLNPQLQVTTLAFPAKMLLSFVLLLWTLSLYPRVMSGVARQIGDWLHIVIP